MLQIDAGQKKRKLAKRIRDRWLFLFDGFPLLCNHINSLHLHVYYDHMSYFVHVLYMHVSIYINHNYILTRSIARSGGRAVNYRLVPVAPTHNHGQYQSLDPNSAKHHSSPYTLSIHVFIIICSDQCQNFITQ
jgi:hypothetical protein